nr:peptidyl serine alpha-galactosyltransferase [Ipomoea batatas]
MARIAAFFVVAAATAVALISGVWAQSQEAPWRIHTLFSVECQNYFDWQTVGLMHSFRKAGILPINKPAGVVHWLKHSKEAENVDWVVILDADMIIRGPIIPWELGAEKGRPVAAYYGYLVGCDNVLAKLHTTHPELCDKVGGLLAMHIDDLRALAPMWLSKTEEVRGDRAHWATNYTVGLQHKINDNLMIYPGYIPERVLKPILLHYGLPFSVGNWSFSKLKHHEDNIVYDCGRLFPEPPYPREVKD